MYFSLFALLRRCTINLNYAFFCFSDFHPSILQMMVMMAMMVVVCEVLNASTSHNFILAENAPQF